MDSPGRPVGKPVLLFALLRDDPPGQMTGGTRSNLEIVTRLRGFTPVVVTNLDDVFVATLRARGVRVRMLPFADPGKGFGRASLLARFLSLWQVLRTNLSIARLAREEGAWAVQVDEVQSYLAFLGARLARRRLLVFVRNGIAPGPLRARYRIPMQAAAGIVCLSREMASMLSERLPSSARRRIWQHFNAVDMETLGGAPATWKRTEFRRAAGWRDDAVVAVVVGFVDGRKRQAELLAALARNPDPRLHIAIVGPSKDPACWNVCQQTVAMHQLQVTFHGYQSDIAPWYRAADVVALPSSSEGIPRVVLEGAAAGLPAVAFDIPGCRESLVDGVTGILADSMDSFVRALSRLAGSADLRRSMGEAGRAYVNEHFEAQRNIERLESLYRTIGTDDRGVDNR